MINESIFKAYDIRGNYPSEINEEVAYLIGKSYGSYLQEFCDKNKCVIGHDNRLSSPSLTESLKKGLLESGINVIDYGLITTPMHYYTRYKENTYGIMVTASHNPKDDNGFKFSFDNLANARGEMIEDFKNYVAGIKNLSASYIDSMLSTLKGFLEFVNDHIFDCKYENITEMTLNDIRFLNTSDIYGFIFYLAENHNSIGTRIKKIEHLRTFFDFLYKIKTALFKEPLKTIKREKNTYIKLPKYLSLSESKKILQVYANKDDFRSLRNNAMLHLFLCCGLRLEELNEIKISDFDFNENKFIILGKGNKERTCYLNTNTKDALQKYINYRKNNPLDDKKIDNFLFISQWNKKISSRQIRKIVKKTYEKAEIDETQYSVHSLRHSFATILYKSGVDIRLLQILLGHSRIETTQIYAHMHSESLMNAMQGHPMSHFKIKDALAFNC